VLYRTPEGTQLRLRSLVGHTVIGEMGLYRTMPRGASVRADIPTAAYRLSRTAMEEIEQRFENIQCNQWLSREQTKVVSA
jgi:CRP-like cAMP-binding protein